jgi:hypothetical protein
VISRLRSGRLQLRLNFNGSARERLVSTGSDHKREMQLHRTEGFYGSDQGVFGRRQVVLLLLLLILLSQKD